MDAEEESDLGEEGSEEEPIGGDMPCVACGYNLRGLKGDGRCPECGAAVEKTLAFLNERELCTACLRPNHPMASRCEHCGAVIGAAAETADYWRPRAIGGGRPRPAKSTAEDEPEPPSFAWPLMCWLSGLMVLTALAVRCAGPWMDAPEPGALEGEIAMHRAGSAILFAAIAAVLIGFILHATRGHVRAKREYRRKLAEFLTKEEKSGD